MIKCVNADRYKARRAPRCNAGKPCQTCRSKWAVAQRTIEAEENLLIDVQFRVQELMMLTGASREQVAKAADVSVEWFADFLAAEADPTLKQVGRIFHVLGHKLDVKTRALN